MDAAAPGAISRDAAPAAAPSTVPFTTAMPGGAAYPSGARATRTFTPPPAPPCPAPATMSAM